MTSPSPLPSDAQLDALREVANIGCGHAANALARLMGDRVVNVSVPSAALVRPLEASSMLGAGGPDVLCAKLRVEGALEGMLLLVHTQEDAQALQALLLPGNVAPEEAESALMEVANILASACLSAIGGLTGWRLMPSVPSLVRAPAAEVLAGALGEVRGGAERVMLLEARLDSPSAPAIAGQLLLLLDEPSSTRLLERLGV